MEEEVSDNSKKMSPDGHRVTRMIDAAVWPLAAKWVTILLCFFLNLITVIICVALSGEKRILNVPSLCSIVFVILYTMVSIVQLQLLRRLRATERNLSWVFFILEGAKITLTFLMLFTMIAKIINIVGSSNASGFGMWSMVSVNTTHTPAQSATVEAFCVLSIIADLINTVAFSYDWLSTGRVPVLFFFCGIAQFCLGTLEVEFDRQISQKWTAAHIPPIQGLYMHLGSLNTAAGIISLCLCFIITDKNRLSTIVRNLIIFVDCYLVLTGILSLVAFCTTLKKNVTIDPDLPVSSYFGVICALFGCNFIISVVIILCTRYYRLRHAPRLMVEVIDLSSMNPIQKTGYAHLIDFNSRSNPGILGETALALMETYSQSKVPNVRCKVLRVYNDKDVFDGPSRYTNRKGLSTWEVLDQEKTIFGLDSSNTQSEQDIRSLIEDNLSQEKPLSKNQRKRLAKKAAKKRVSKSLDSILDKEKSQSDFLERQRIYKELMSTEALVLLTAIDNYDLTEAIPGKFGRALGRMFGKDSKLRLLTIRFGLLGYHWPFKRATFYTSSTKRPVARSAAVMYAISKWNKKQPCSERCTMLLDPLYKNELPSEAIEYGGWYKINLPASHIIDLRPHKNQNISQYLKSIKYRNQDGNFIRNGGEYIEIKDFSMEDCHKVIKLWNNIAESRASSGRTAMLATPDVDFIYHLGLVANEKKDRTLLFLKVNDTIIASCVLFRLGDTITSDLQGLDHEVGRHYKAYFVMMQKVISIALEEGRSFVDFGPTTEKPKLDIGCSNVPLTGAIRANQPILSPVIAYSADQVNV